MTTAHRTTYRSTMALKDESSSIYVVPTRQFAARDCASYKVMKDRKTYQKDFHKISKKGQLRRKQNEIFRKITKKIEESEEDEAFSKPKIKKPKTQDIIGSNYTGPRVQKEIESSDDEDADDQDFVVKSKQSGDQQETQEIPQDFSSDDDDDDSDDEDGDSDDEEAILLEYERVKKEREERERQEIKDKVEEEGDIGQGYSLQKKWFQETVFQNQSVKEKKEKPEFCNDTVRSKFHKKVLHKFVWT